MTMITLDVNPDELDNWLAQELRRCYVDTVTIWKHQPESPELAAALLVVIEHYSAPDEFEEWKQSL